MNSSNPDTIGAFLTGSGEPSRRYLLPSVPVLIWGIVQFKQTTRSLVANFPFFVHILLSVPLEDLGVVGVLRLTVLDQNPRLAGPCCGS
jgi:hypothetical protein